MRLPAAKIHALVDLIGEAIIHARVGSRMQWTVTFDGKFMWVALALAADHGKR